MKKNFEQGLYNGKGVVNEMYGRGKRNVRQTQYVPQKKVVAEPNERDVVSDKMIARMRGEKPMGFTYQNANGGEYEVYGDKRYRFTDKEGKVSQIWDGKYVTQEAIDYCNANGIIVSEEKQYLYATTYDSDGVAKDADFSFVSLYDEKYNGKMIAEDANGNEKEIKIDPLQEGDFIFYSGGSDGEEKLVIWNKKHKHKIERKFSVAHELGYVKHKENVYIQLDDNIECIKGRQFCALERSSTACCILRTMTGEPYIHPVKVQGVFRKLLGILTGEAFIKELMSRMRSIFGGYGKEDKELREQFKSLDGQYKQLKGMVVEDQKRINELQQKISRATGVSATEDDLKPIVAHSDGVYSDTLRKFFVGLVEADIDKLNIGDEVYLGADRYLLTFYVGEKDKLPEFGGQGDTFCVNMTGGRRIKPIGVMMGYATIKDSSGTGRKVCKIRLPKSVNFSFGLNPAVGDSSHRKPTAERANNNIIYIDEIFLQDFSPDTSKDVVERKILGGVISAWNKTIGYYTSKEYGADSKECKDNFLNPLMKLGYAGDIGTVKSLLATICDENHLGGEPYDLWEKCFRKLGWVNDLSYNKDGFYSLYEYDIWFDEMKELYERDEVANSEVITILHDIGEIRKKVDADNVTKYPKTKLAIQFSNLENEVEGIWKLIKSVFVNSKAIIDAIDEAKAIRSRFTKDGDLFNKCVEYETKIGKEEDAVGTLGDKIEEAEKKSKDESLSLDEREQANDYVIENYERFENASQHLENLRQKFEDWKADKIQPFFDRLDELAGVCPRCAKIDNKTRSKFARQQYKAIKKELKDYFKSTYGKGWKKKFKAKKIELRNAKYEITRGKYQTWWSKFGHACTSAGMLPCRNIIQAMMMLNLGSITTMVEEIYNNAESGNKECKKYYDDFLNKWYSLGGKKEKFTKWVKKYGKAKPVIENMGDVGTDNLESTFKSQNLDLNEIANAEEGKLNAIGSKLGYDKEQSKALQTLCQYYNAVGIDDYISAQIASAGGFWKWIGGLIVKAYSVLKSVLTVVGGLLKKNEENCSGNVAFTGDEDVEGALGAMELCLFNKAVKDKVIKNITQDEVDEITALIEQGTSWTDAVVKVHGGEFFTDEQGNLCYKNPSNIGTFVAVGVCVLAVVGIAYVLLSDSK